MTMQMIGFNVSPNAPTIGLIKRVWEINFAGAAALTDFPQFTNTIVGTGVTGHFESVGGTFGAVQFKTGANAGSSNLLTTDKGFRLAAGTITPETKRYVFECEIAFNSATTDAEFIFGIRKDADEYCYINIPAGAIWLKSDDGGTTQTSVNTGLTVSSGDNVQFRIEIDLDTDTPYLYVDNELAASGTASSIAKQNAYYLYMYVDNGANATDVNFRFLGARMYYK